MFEAILKTLRENKLATGLILILIYILIFGVKGAMYVAIAEVFTFVYFWIVTSGNDDDHWNFPDNKDPRFA
jgi:hypothetical protein